MGDQQAFQHLYRATSAKLYSLALRILRRGDWAEEVLQEAFVNIWHHASDYQASKAAPLTWMTHIVRNRALDWLRRPQHEDLASDDMLEQWRDDSVDMFERLAHVKEAAALNNCLNRLDAKQRQTIALAFWHGLTHSELAAHLRQPLGTIKTWIRRGLATLRTCLDDANEL